MKTLNENKFHLSLYIDCSNAGATMEISHNNPDLEPLIASNTNGTKLIKKEKKDKHFGLSRKRDAKSSKLHIIGVLGFFIFLLIYLSFAQNLRPYQHMVVHIPDDDITLPGPKG